MICLWNACTLRWGEHWALWRACPKITHFAPDTERKTSTSAAKVFRVSLPQRCRHGPKKTSIEPHACSIPWNINMEPRKHLIEIRNIIWTNPPFLVSMFIIWGVHFYLNICFTLHGKFRVLLLLGEQLKLANEHWHDIPLYWSVPKRSL